MLSEYQPNLAFSVPYLRKHRAEASNLPMPLEDLAGQDLSELEKKALAKQEEAKRRDNPAQDRRKEETRTTVHHGDGSVTTTTVTQEITVVTTPAPFASSGKVETREETVIASAEAAETEKVKDSKEEEQKEKEEETPKRDIFPVSESDSVFLGLKVYTHRSEKPVVINGQLRHEIEVSASLALN